jgi:hypothetical protein
MTIREQTNAALVQAVSQGIITSEEYSLVLALQKENDFYKTNLSGKIKEGYFQREEIVMQIFKKIFG